MVMGDFGQDIAEGSKLGICHCFTDPVTQPVCLSLSFLLCAMAIIIAPISDGLLWGLSGEDAEKALSPVLGTCSDISSVSEWKRQRLMGAQGVGPGPAIPESLAEKGEKREGTGSWRQARA